MPADAAVLRPVLDSMRGLAIAQAINPTYSRIDAYHMTAVTIDEAVRRVMAVGGDPEHIGGIDNFCWPEIRFDPEKNPDGKYKAAQLVRVVPGAEGVCLAMRHPAALRQGQHVHRRASHRPVRGIPQSVRAETMQFATISVVPDVGLAVSMDAKIAGDRVYVSGFTRDEMGASEYYAHFGYVGRNAPQVRTAEFSPIYRAVNRAVEQGLVASVHGVYRGGLGVHLAMVAMGGPRVAGGCPPVAGRGREPA